VTSSDLLSRTYEYATERVAGTTFHIPKRANRQDAKKSRLLDIRAG
jgi:hypothetical protein